MTDDPHEALAEMVRGGSIPWPEELELEYPLVGDGTMRLTDESMKRSGHDWINPVVVQSRGDTAGLAIERWRRVIMATLEAWPSRWFVWRIRPEITRYERDGEVVWAVYSRLALL